MSVSRLEPNDAPRLRRGRWRRRLAGLAVCAVILVCAIWGAAIWLTERAEPFAGAPLPTRVGIEPGEPYRGAVAAARTHIQALMAERRVPGLSVAVAVDGRIVWSEGFGYADRQAMSPATAETKFRVASVSKCFTAAAVLRLHEQGRLDLDAPIRKYVPGFPDKGVTVTARQLLVHRSGIRAYRDDLEAITATHYSNATDSLEAFMHDPLVFPPGTEFLYSNYGYVLLSAAVEAVTEQDFPTAMRQLVFEPLGMRGTIEDNPRDPALRKATCYDHEPPFSPDGSVVESPFIDFSGKWASGGFLSTAEDMARFGSAHLDSTDGGFLRRDTLDMMFTPSSSQAGLIGYGMGWMTARDLHSRRVRFHFGAGSGGTSVLAVYPGDRVCVAMVGNLGHARFPYHRLAGVVNPFLGDPARGWIGGFFFAALIGGIYAGWRRFRRRRAAKAVHGACAES